MTSKLVWDCIQSLNFIAIKNSIPPIDGNEEADTLAKKGTQMQVHGPTPFCGISIEIAKNRIKEWLKIKAINN